ncbi:hypothetical protein [Paenibacillus dendritiformis]|uniref:hypothetical protein n=1 Tax=Paenibacillus dendritiformis TaxID=130049 RepID=UPI000DA9E8D3|nr:hypothetical protein [Paenibacillus dendritiformis]PZM63731.1 hypothetical protein DOE73_20610 [Paenibacillus dendritiformis]
MNLFVVTVFCGGDQFIYAVVAEHLEEAQKRTVMLVKEEMLVEDEKEIETDSELTFEITCASDIHGKLYYIQLTEAAYN